jgi:uncharacterized NAD(P)/FAD-binding protein YdhS
VTDEPLLARRSKTAIFEQFDAEAVVLDPETDRYVWLNATGSWLWQMLDATVGSDQLAARLANEWDVQHDRAHRDVLTFLRSLSERGLVELTPP